MKFLSIATVLLVLIIVIAQAAPLEQTGELTKRKVGNVVKPLGVRFKDLYQQFTNQVQKVNKKFDHEIKKFNEKIPAAAAADGTDKEDTQWLLDWNEKYAKLVGDLKDTSGKLDKSIQNLGKKLDS